MTTRVWRPGRPVDVCATLAVMRRGSGDPTWRTVPGGCVKAWRTPAGDAAVLIRAIGGEVEAMAWGRGGSWVCDQVPALLGDADDWSGFVPRHRLVEEAQQRFPGWRVPRTGLVLEALVPSIIEQLVTGVEAFGGYRLLVRRFGAAAPGPWGEQGLRLAPTPSQWARIPSWEWVKAGVDASRSDTVMRAATRAGRLEEATAMTWEQARRRLQAVVGVGVWTSAEVAHVALGDPDAVSFGDYHVAKDIGWALLGTPVDDAGLAELLAPYAGHRYRVQRLLELAGHHRPRRGPRMALRAHTPSS